MKPIKSVYMFTDLEGVAGIDDWDPRHREDAAQARGVSDRYEMQQLLTAEVNAAAEGLFEAGVEEIMINDAHGAGRTILVQDLVPGVQIIRGRDRPGWMLGISPRFDALVQIGMHAMSGTPEACLAHTQSRGYVYRINGREFGEMEQAALLAGELGIPWIFTSGDAHACTEAVQWVPRMITAPVKTGLSLNSAIHLNPVDACALIMQRITDAIRLAGEIHPLSVQNPVVMEITYHKPWDADRIRPGAVLVDANTIRYTGDNFWSVFHHHFYGRPDYPLPVK
ncbi:MAG: M55 family metallopeptidase [Anaerolineae bacterium]|nr:M55 family metallopeptidase [Anaerolineae bacterium]